MTAGQLRIELDVFSGRPNPSWVLDAQQSALVAARIRPGAACTTKEAGLGYRGFLIHNVDEASTNPRPLRVWQGTISTSEDGQKSNLDTERLEDYLIEMAVARGYGSLLGIAR
jgi:hypothetical protein